MEENTQNNTDQSKNKFSYRTLILTILVAVIFSSVFGFLSGAASVLIMEKTGLLKKSAEQDATIGKRTVVEDDSTVIQAVENASPSVVSIIVTKDVPRFRSFFGGDFEFFFSPFRSYGDEEEPTEKQKVGGGSGFFVSEDGMIVTNKHVVSDTEADYTVMTNDGEEYKAQVLARDPVRDVAAIKIEGKDFPVLEIGDSDNLKVGQTVVAIGYSLGEFANTVSKGIISGLKRNVVAGSSFGQAEQLTDIIQTDAAINPGNSGGPLVDLDGKVIGINIAMAQGAENIGFALPVNQVKKIVEQVKTKGEIKIPFLGIRYVIINESLRKANNLPFDYGALVIRGEKVTELAVIPGSPADKAGIVENDIVLEFDGQKITGENQLANMIVERDVGETVTLKIWHKGETKEVKVTLEERK